MDERTMELVGIAAAIAGHCQPCFQHHYKKANELGIPANDINEAIDLARRIGASGDRHMLEFAREEMKSGGDKNDR